MLAEFLIEVRPQVRRWMAEHAASESKLQDRLPDLLDALIGALQRGSADATHPDLDPEVALAGYDVLRKAVFEQMERHALDVPRSELRLASDWLAAGISKAAEDSVTRIRRLSALLDAVPDQVGLVDTRGKLLYGNRAMLEDIHAATSLPTDQLVGRSGHELGMSLRLMEQFERERLEVLAGRTVRAEVPFPTPSGDRWREHTMGPVFRDGVVEAIAINSRDVHERKLAQYRLQLLSKMSTVLEASDYEDVLGALARVSIPELADWCVIDMVEGNTIRRAQVAHHDPSLAALADELRHYPLTPSCRERYGHEALSGRSRLMAEVTDDLLYELAPCDYELVRRIGPRSVMIVPSIVQGETIAITTFMITSESRRYCPQALTVAEELARRAAQVIETARLHERIKKSEERFRVALANSRIAVFEQDRRLRYLYLYSPAYHSGKAYFGKTQYDLFAREDADKLTAIKRRVLETGEPVREEVHIVGFNDGEEMLLAVDPVRDASGKVVGVIGSATNITDVKRTQTELAQAVELRELVMGILGHDLRNPLGAVAMSTASLLRNPKFPDQFRDVLSRVDRATRRMTEMIETLLDVTESRSKGALQIVRAPSDLHEAVRRVIDELRDARPERVIELDLRGEGRGNWDVARLEQVASNLVGNALTHGTDGSPVRVTLDSDPATVTLRVTNQGPSIPPETIPMLFEPFRRGSERNRSRGLGLGLYIVRQVVLAHGGTIDVASSAADGTTFTVRLPRQAAVALAGSD